MMRGVLCLTMTRRGSAIYLTGVDDVHRNVQAEIAHVLEESALMSFLRVRGVRLSEMNR